MKKSRWSDYDKFTVMVDGGGYRSIVGVCLGYEAFCEFRIVKQAINEISNSKGRSYSFKGKVYSSPITTSKAQRILEKIENCKWDDDIRKIAKQIGECRKLLTPNSGR